MKLKLLLASGLFIFSLCVVNAQKDTVEDSRLRFILSVSSGASSSLSANVSNAGGMANGESFNVFGFLGKHSSFFGWGSIIGVNLNGLSVPPNYYPGFYFYPIEGLGQFMEIYTGVGPCLDIHIKKFILDIRALFGPAIDESPGLSLKFYTGATGVQDRGFTFAAPFNFGIGLRYQVTSRISVGLCNYFFYSSPTYDNSNYYLQEAHISLINCTAGLSCNFGGYNSPAPYFPSFLDSLQMDSIPKDSNKYRSKAYVSINYGDGTPGGSFHRVNSNGEGGALDGPTWSITAGIPIGHSHYGIAGMFEYEINSFNQPLFETIIYQQRGLNINSYLLNPSKYTETDELIGINATIPEGRVSFDARLMGGEVEVTTPALTYSSYYTSYTSQSPIQPFTGNVASRSLGIAVVDIGITMRIQLYKKICATVNEDILNTPTDMISVLNSTVGIGYQF